MTKEGAKVRVREHYTLRKFNGEYREGAKPVETIEVDVVDGEVVSIKRTKEEDQHAADKCRP